MTRPPALTQSERDTEHPWERFGWVMGSIWLVFLLFPLTSAFTAESSWAWRSFGVAAILAFAAVYVYGFIRIGRTESSAQVNRLGWRCLALLVSLAGATALVIGLDALGMVVFIIAFAMCSLRLAAALGVGVAGIAIAVLVPLVNVSVWALIFALLATWLVRRGRSRQ